MVDANIAIPQVPHEKLTTMDQITTPSSPIPTATASIGVVGAIVGLICSVLGRFKWDVTGVEATYMIVVLTPIVHILAIRFGFFSVNAKEQPHEDHS